MESQSQEGRSCDFDLNRIIQYISFCLTLCVCVCVCNRRYYFTTTSCIETSSSIVIRVWGVHVERIDKLKFVPVLNKAPNYEDFCSAKCYRLGNRWR